MASDTTMNIRLCTLIVPLADLVLEPQYQAAPRSPGDKVLGGITTATTRETCATVTATVAAML